MAGAATVAPGRSGTPSVRAVVRGRHGRIRHGQGRSAEPIPVVRSDPGRCRGRVHEGDDQGEGEQARPCTAPGAIGAAAPRPQKPDQGRGHGPRRSGRPGAGRGGRCRPPARSRRPARDAYPAIERADPGRPTLHAAPLGRGLHPGPVASPRRAVPERREVDAGRARRPGAIERAPVFERSAPAQAVSSGTCAGDPHQGASTQIGSATCTPAGCPVASRRAAEQAG